MNIPLEAPSDQSDLVREPSDAFADAAKRDLNESQPMAEAGAPSSDADVGPAAVPDASVAAGGRLRRLETTLSQLPRAAQLPPVPALPIGRISLDRTQQRPPPRPIWLQKQRTQPPPPPLPERGVLWPRAAKFLIACGIAALLSYYLVVSTSPLQKHLVEVTELAPVVQEPPAQHAPEPQDGMRPSVAGSDSAPPEQRAFGSERLIEKLEFPTSLPAGTAIRSSAEKPPADRASVPPTKTANLQEVKLLIDRGRQFFEAGDLMAARIVFLRAVIAGEAEAAVAMGATYDPVVLGDRGGDADLDKARSWYERATEMGSPEGPRRLEMLVNR